MKDLGRHRITYRDWYDRGTCFEALVTYDHTAQIFQDERGREFAVLDYGSRKALLTLDANRTYGKHSQIIEA